jgi:hypothetical protein
MQHCVGNRLLQDRYLPREQILLQEHEDDLELKYGTVLQFFIHRPGQDIKIRTLSDKIRTYGHHTHEPMFP